jgi:hypothetical protein
MYRGLTDARPGKRLFCCAEIEPGDPEFVRRYLASYESALIQCAAAVDGAKLNTHMRKNRR